MKILNTLILVLLAHNCFSQDTLFLDSNWGKTNRNNAKFFRIDIKENNKWTRTDYFFDSKRIQMKGTYLSIEPEIEDGYFERYHSNGQIKQKGNYANGKEIGEHLWYNSNGGLDAKENYKDGLLNGDYEEYYPNGKLMDKSSFQNGKQHGWTVYYREDGSKHSEGSFKNGKRDGDWKYFDNKGNIEGTTNFKTEYTIPEGDIFIELPTDDWSLFSHTNDKLIQYIFKREEVTDSLGRSIIPAIMLYVEDAKGYKQDLVFYSINKRMAFKNKGIVVDSILSPDKENYPLALKNSLIILTSYSDKGFDHILFMIHIITKSDKGIQLYMDMTKEIAPKYEEEFWNTIRSLKEIK
jgi:antitoxin component YwqK of YwqJK toxin-antitoxin module